MTEKKNYMAVPLSKKRGKIPLVAGGIAAVVLIGGYFVVQNQIADSAEDEITRLLRANQLDRAIRYRNLEASLFGQSVTLNNVRMDFGDTQGTIEALTISDFELDERSGHLNSINLRAANADFPIQPGRSSWLRRASTPPPYLIGIYTLQGDFGLKYEYDNVDGKLDASIDFELPSLVEGTFNINVGNINLPPVDRMSSRNFAQTLKLLEDAGNANLQAVEVSVTDLGLEDKIAEYMSVKNGAALDAPSYRDQIYQTLSMQIENNPPKNTFESRMADIAKSALQSSGGTLSVSYEPEYPTTFEDISSGMFGLMMGGFGALGQSAIRNGEVFDDLLERDVLQIEFDG
jgi:hypothetical protein